MNILKNYCVRINGFTEPLLRSILENKNNKYVLSDKANIYTIKNMDNQNITILKCIEQCYTNREDNKAIKIPKTNARCYNTRKEFGLLDEVRKEKHCDLCHLVMLDKFDDNLVKILKK